MSLSKYHYNSETCRYEPSSITFSSVVGYAVLFCITTVLIFGGILFLHSKVYLTENGKALKKENSALTKHYASLQQRASIIETSINSLRDKDAKLHEKLFEVPLERTDASPASGEQKSLLLADASTFRDELYNLTTRTTALSKVAVNHNDQFSTLSVRKKDKAFLVSVPSIQPVQITETTKLVSGFGMRVNPFHKGNYNHPGADFAAARGTAVVATGNGVILKAVKGSMLQAGYGNYVDIQHKNGLITRYAHLDEVRVSTGQNVLKGFTIGTVGMSGGSVAPHVHYEIIRKGDPVDPVPYMLEGLNSNQYSELQKLGRKKNQSLD